MSDLDLAGFGNGDVGGGARYRDGGLNLIALISHQLALVIDAQIARAGIGGLAGGHQHLQEAASVNADVQLVAGGRHRPLLADPIDGTRLDPGAHLDAGRHYGALIGGLGARALQVLIEQILKLGPLAFVAHGVHIGDIVGDDFDVQLLGGHARCGGAEGLHCSAFPIARDPSARRSGGTGRLRNP